MKKLLLLLSLVASQAAISAPVDGKYQFSGPATMSAFGLSANCTLSFSGVVETKGNGDLILSIDDGMPTGGSFVCQPDVINFANFSWKGEISKEAQSESTNGSVGVTFSNGQTIVAGERCSEEPSSFEVVYSNNGQRPSSFKFNFGNENCAIQGVVEIVGEDVNFIQ